MRSLVPAAFAPLATAALLLLAASAAAQSGPAPGYDTGLAYAQDYAGQQAENASQDPAGYAQGKADAQALDEEARHTAYMACWIVDDAAEAPAACDNFYTSPGEGNPEPVVDNETAATADAVKDAVQNTTQATGEFVQEVVEDPTDAPNALQRFLGSLLGTILGILAAAVDAGGSVLSLLPDALAVGFTGGVDGVRVLSDLSMQTVTGTGDLLAEVSTRNAAAYTTAYAATTAAAVDTSVSLVDGAVALGRGAADGAVHVRDVTVELGSSIGDGVTAAWEAVSDTVSQWFGSQAAPEEEDVPVDAPLDVEVDPSLLDEVLTLV